MKARRQHKRCVCKVHHLGGGLATAHRGHSSTHTSNACPAVSSKASEGAKASRASTASSEGGHSCDTHEDGPGGTQSRWRLWEWVLLIWAMLLVPFVSAGACGAAVGTAVHQACHTICRCVGLKSSNCLRLHCSLFGRDVTALLDSGASHCFVDKKWLSRHNLGLQPVKLNEPTSFMQANGSSVVCDAVYPRLKLKLGKKVVFVQDIPMDLGWSDGGEAVILGQSFLQAYNPRIDWKKREVFIGRYCVPVVDQKQGSSPVKKGSAESVASGGSSPVKKGSAEEGDMFINRLQAKR